ncbi:hypothetical protein LUQ84_001816 [Hamiltosporidium tvaerminnensis]|nr:hypothetical protein LUQ84_001816 [Hamiltosporidium tvaerminnensis]
MIRYVLYGNGYKNWYVNLGLSFIGCTDVIEAENMECGMVRYDNREEGVNDRDRLEGVGDCNGLEGVNDRDRSEGVNDRDRSEGVNYSTNTLHPVNSNTTTFTLWNSFVFGDCKLSEILKYFKRKWAKCR